MAGKKTTKTEETSDAALTITVHAEFKFPYKENERRNRKPVEILGIDTEGLSDAQIQDAIDVRAAELLETAGLQITHSVIDKE